MFHGGQARTDRAISAYPAFMVIVLIDSNGGDVVHIHGEPAGRNVSGDTEPTSFQKSLEPDGNRPPLQSFPT